MKKGKKLLAGMIAAAVLLGCSTVFPAAAAAGTLPSACSNQDIHLRKNSYLQNTADGYMRVYVSDQEEDTDIHIEYYDKQFQLTEKKSIPRELEYWGGFFEGADNYFTVEGTKNMDETDTQEVLRVNKYDKDWNKLGTAKITGNPDMFGGEVRYPFDYGCCEMTELNGTLYIATGHEGYVDESVGQGHQGLLLVMMDESTMTGQIADCDLGHSFAQYLDNDGSSLYLFENSEGGRCSMLTQYDPSVLPADYFDTQNEATILEYGGNRTSAWAIPTYAECSGIALSGDNVLTLGTSVDQDKYGEDFTYNLYVGVTPKDNVSTEATTFKWLTNLTSSEENTTAGVENAQITKINDDRFLVSWTEQSDSSNLTDMNDPLSDNVLHYMFIDGTGDPIGYEQIANAAYSECRPIYDGTNVVFYSSSSTAVDFYSINATSGAFSKKVYRVIGENVTWNYAGGVLTVSGTGDMSVLSSDDTWSYFPVWPKELQDKVTKIVVKRGVTSISENAFTYFDNLKEVVIENGVRSIGKQAFYESGLSKITIPASVTDIGEDIVWSGSYWVGDNSHVYWAVIYVEKGSAAEAYAKKYNISYEYYDAPAAVEGDVNGDGVFNVADAACLQKWLLADPDASLADWTAGDLNEDDSLNAMDLCRMKQMLLSQAS